MNKMEMDKIFVFMDHNCLLGYHCFADSENNGPRGQAFITEFHPYIEKNCRVIPESGGRLLTGQSSGAWAALWLQVAYPDHFGRAWPASPDPVDFRLFRESMAGLGSDAFIKILDSGGHGDGVWKQIIGKIHEQMDALLCESHPELKE